MSMADQVPPDGMGFDCEHGTSQASEVQNLKQHKKLVATVALGAVCGLIGFLFLDQQSAANDKVISFDLGCLEEHLRSPAGRSSAVVDCEVGTPSHGLGETMARAFAALPLGHRAPPSTISHPGQSLLSHRAPVPEMKVGVGDAFPSVEVDYGFPPERVNIAERIKGEKAIVVPGYLAKQSELKAKGIAEVIVFCCNDGAVMKAWGKDQGVEGSMITFMGDTQGDLTEALGVTMTHPGPTSVLGAPRCQRTAMYVENGIIKAFEIAASEDDPAGDSKPDVTLVENMLSKVPDP